MSRRLITRNTVVENQRIEVNLEQGDFESLHGVWCFEETQGGTWVSLDFNYVFSHTLVQYTFGQKYIGPAYD